MSKRGPLSKIEKFYIEKNLELGIDNLSSDLDRAKSVVRAYSEKCRPKIKTKDTPLNQQIVSNGQGSTIMTENGSMLADSFKSKRGESTRPNCVEPTKK